MKANVRRLRAKIIENGMTQSELAKELSMSQSTFSRKIKSEALSFSVGEMHAICQLLKLSNEEAKLIFLSE